MAGRLIVISNRIPLEGPGSGGLVVALHEALTDRGGIWIGAQETDADTASEKFTRHEAPGYEKLTFELTAKDQEEYYLGFSNSVLWPLCHRRTDLIDFESRYADGYERVNRRLAHMLAEILEPEDRVWVHDYHFFPLACFLRELGVKNRVGYFLHIPFPNGSDLPALPHHETFIDWISSYDLIGLQTQRDVAVCLEFFRGHPKAELLLDGSAKYGSRTTQVRSFPIGIDVDVMLQAADARRADATLRLGDGERLIIGVDRLDYSKGLVNRLKAMESWLQHREPDEPRATLLQIAPPSREKVLAYREIRDEMELLTGKINGEYSEIDWTPVRYIHKPVERELLAALYRRADVGLVTSLADGMNLVAKEYVASQDPEDPGVLVLSNFAGAAEQMPDALIVNPYDVDEVGEAISQALRMPLDERKARYRELMRGVQEQDIRWWTRAYLDALARCPVNLATETEGSCD
ncbi:alpha,alpha-trehalose-phosphate synthase (UDP-forming) [Tranquillimonas alkanivorans]|uniref:Trehalose 6-phosphate synthase n=1 Tax=Tranquillimonas alkanivorans TaxID=441119 RepID=A0A1I5S288_9RHOB|nr:trehalose-6-phosphate synthase [Tranquillimonas alkanivorans]SFP64898.1 trehalose 6-phosphate synthase [Tranquillimonas alkanivorans]